MFLELEPIEQQDKFYSLCQKRGKKLFDFDENWYSGVFEVTYYEFTLKF